MILLYIFLTLGSLANFRCPQLNVGSFRASSTHMVQIRTFQLVSPAGGRRGNSLLMKAKSSAEADILADDSVSVGVDDKNGVLLFHLQLSQNLF